MTGFYLKAGMVDNFKKLNISKKATDFASMLEVNIVIDAEVR